MSKKFVNKQFPNAYCKKCIRQDGTSYYLIYLDKKRSMWFALGDTEKEAWNVAKFKLEKN